MQEAFCWRCVVLDDRPEEGVEQTIRLLDNYGVHTQVFSTPEEIKQNAAAIQEAHLFLCDLQFTNFGNSSIDRRSIPTTVEDPDQYVADWVDAVASWNNTAAKPSGRGVPRTRIENDDVGFWLAAMCSNVNPDAEILFYTSARDVIERELAAIEQFRGSYFGVDTKKASAPVSQTAINVALERRQHRLLRSKSGRPVYQWFLQSAFLPVLLGRSPEPGTAVQLSSLQPDKEFSLNAERVFPQLREARDGEAKRSFLRRFLTTEPWQLEPWEHQSLSALEHDLRLEKVQSLANVKTQDQVRYLDRVSSLAAHAGTVGLGVLAVLEVAKGEMKSNGSWPVALLQSAYGICRGANRNAESDLEALCDEFMYGADGDTVVGAVVDVESACAVEPGLLGNQGDPKLPFPLGYLRRVAAALRNNAEAYTAVEAESLVPLRISIRAFVVRRALTLTWRDNSRGFTSFEHLQAAVAGSVSRPDGAYRGLPLALLFGVEFNAESVEVLIAGDGETAAKWYQLYPASAPDGVDATEQAGFGMRWKFAHGNSPS